MEVEVGLAVKVRIGLGVEVDLASRVDMSGKGVETFGLLSLSPISEVSLELIWISLNGISKSNQSGKLMSR